MINQGKPSKMTAGKSFWCERWHQQVYERVCMHRYRKGMKKCEGCEKGAELVREEIGLLQRENQATKSN